MMVSPRMIVDKIPNSEEYVLGVLVWGDCLRN